MTTGNPQHATTEHASHASHAWSTRYVDLLREQESLLRQLDAWSLGQRAMIDAEDPQPLLELMEKRQVVIDRLESIYEESRPMREQLNTSGAGLAVDVRGQLTALLDTVSSVAQSIMRRDAQDQERMHARKRAAAAELAELASGKRAVNAYRPAAQASGPAFQDREG
jgi:hypothetical protein